MIFKKKGYGSQLNVCKCSWWKRENGDINQVPYNASQLVLKTENLTLPWQECFVALD